MTVPPVLSVPRLEYTAVLGQPVSLECTADGQPKPEVTWHRERRPVVEGAHLRLFSNGTLHITATQRSDAGIYTCSARNNAGRASHDLRLILQSEFHTIPRESLSTYIRRPPSLANYYFLNHRFNNNLYLKQEGKKLYLCGEYILRIICIY